MRGARGARRGAFKHTHTHTHTYMRNLSDEGGPHTVAPCRYSAQPQVNEHVHGQGERYTRPLTPMRISAQASRPLRDAEGTQGCPRETRRLLSLMCKSGLENCVLVCTSIHECACSPTGARAAIPRFLLCLLAHARFPSSQSSYVFFFVFSTGVFTSGARYRHESQSYEGTHDTRLDIQSRALTLYPEEEEMMRSVGQGVAKDDRRA